MNDRVGLSWRRELAAGILCNLERVDLVEVIADDYFYAPRAQLRALETLDGTVPVVLHGLGMGLASASRASVDHMQQMARIAEKIEPEFWSEHLAFVRGDGVEIGHLAAPPRTVATIEGAAENLTRAGKVVGTKPLVENIATLIDPPGSDFGEADWIAKILAESDCDLLLDLHNVYANALNFGFDAVSYLRQIPMERVRAVHLAGGRWITGSEIGAQEHPRLLDDHLHSVPGPVYDLLKEVAAMSQKPLTVIIERDGEYPPMQNLLGQLDMARLAMAEGRARRTKCIEVTSA